MSYIAGDSLMSLRNWRTRGYYTEEEEGEDARQEKKRIEGEE